MKISARNSFVGTITAISNGRVSGEEAQAENGEPAYAIFKSDNVIVATD